MLSSEGKPTDNNSAIANQKPSKTIGTDGASYHKPNQQLEREQIFRLIEEGILCFEACLYHQVLPLKLEYNSLLLGIVNPKDTVALEYVNNILSYLKITVATQTVTAEAHRIILSEYLNYKNASSESKLEKQDRVDSNNVPYVENRLITEKMQNLEEEEESLPGDNTLILFDSPNRVNLKSVSNQQRRKSPVKTLNHENKQESKQESKQENKQESKQENKQENKQESHKKTDPDIFEIVSAKNLPVLKLPLPESFSADQILPTLPPRKLLNELLARVLAGGIGRLYLERQPYQARILWSLNGIVQSVVEELPLSAFQGVLNELKRLSSLPLMTLAQAKQVETECLYQQQRLLLRLRVMPGMYGEEATLQVLRGAALKFYQQQQLSHISRDALGASQELSYKVRELHQRLAANKPDLNTEQIKALESLNGLVKNLDRQLRILTDIPS
ncbi:pilus assembly protein PilB [Calothrix sp. CCY 0018]|uniref:pilus assembly protein PilB n=1 Tax=Calothrix sp. CCY 0018 TaxID=3103864 RepID=UPI0039C6634A